MNETTIIHIESARWGDRYLCLNCHNEMMISGAHRPKYCYQCGRMIIRIDEKEDGQNGTIC